MHFDEKSKSLTVPKGLFSFRKLNNLFTSTVLYRHNIMYYIRLCLEPNENLSTENSSDTGVLLYTYLVFVHVVLVEFPPDDFKMYIRATALFRRNHEIYIQTKCTYICIISLIRYNVYVLRVF